MVTREPARRPPFAVFLAIRGVVAAVAPPVLIRATTGLIDALSSDLRPQPEIVEQGLIESLFSLY